MKDESGKSTEIGGIGVTIVFFGLIIALLYGIAALRTEDGTLNEQEQCSRYVEITSEFMSLISRVRNSYICNSYQCCTRKYTFWGRDCTKEICFDRSLMESKTKE